MQTPSILQQIAPPNSQVKKSSESNDNIQFKPNNESPSPFKKILNSEVNNQNKNKISTSTHKNEASNVNKEQKSINSNYSIDEEQNEGESISLSNQNILNFVDDIEQLKETKKEDSLIDNLPQTPDNAVGNQALVPTLQIKAENAAAPTVEILNSQSKLTDGLDTSLNSDRSEIQINTTDSLNQANEMNGNEANLELASKTISSKDLTKETDYSLIAKNENTSLKSITPPPVISNKELEMGKTSLNSDEKGGNKIIKNEGKFTIEPFSKLTQELQNKINPNMKIELNNHLEAPPLDLKELPTTNITAKTEANLTHLGVSPEQLKASGLANYIPAQLGTKAWDQAMGQRIIWMVAGGEQSAQLTLNPPDLGPLQVVLKISDNQVDASFISSHLDVRDTLESAMPKLRQMMDDAGIQLSGFSINSQASQSGQNFSQENSSPKIHSTESSQDSNIVNVENSVTKVIKKELGLVDTFV